MLSVVSLLPEYLLCILCSCKQGKGVRFEPDKKTFGYEVFRHPLKSQSREKKKKEKRQYGWKVNWLSEI